jgi:hypothetical protein
MLLCCVSRFIYYYAECHVLFIIVLNVVMLNVIMLSVMAPMITLEAKGTLVNSRGIDITLVPGVSSMTNDTELLCLFNSEGQTITSNQMHVYYHVIGFQHRPLIKL